VQKRVAGSSTAGQVWVVKNGRVLGMRGCCSSWLVLLALLLLNLTHEAATAAAAALPM
jgi:hypothetical protein